MIIHHLIAGQQHYTCNVPWFILLSCPPSSEGLPCHSR